MLIDCDNTKFTESELRYMINTLCTEKRQDVFNIVL